MIIVGEMFGGALAGVWTFLSLKSERLVHASRVWNLQRRHTMLEKHQLATLLVGRRRIIPW